MVIGVGFEVDILLAKGGKVFPSFAFVLDGLAKKFRIGVTGISDYCGVA